jgi:hypothetical protein
MKLINKYWFIFILIIFLAAFLRLYRIDLLMRFVWDEGRDMLAIRKIIVDQDITLMGPFNEMDGKKDFFGVFHYYLMLPALYLANFNPVGPAIFTAILGVFAVALAYFWLSQWLKKKDALAVTSLLAVSPLVVRYNQWPWNPNSVGFFVMVYLIAIYFYQNKTKSFHKIFFASLAGLSLGLLFQLHYFSIAVGIIYLVIFSKQKKKDWLSLLMFSLFAILPNLTFVIFDITHQGFYRKIIFESLFGETKQNFVSFSLFGIILGPIQYMFGVISDFFSSWILGTVFSFVWFVYLIKIIKKFIKEFTKTEYLDEQSQLIISWIFFLILTSLFPSLLDNYHSATLWIGIALPIVLFLKQFFKKKYLYILIPLISYLIYANYFWREPTWMENMPKLQRAGEVIAADIEKQASDQINIASFVDSDTRATRFRYFIDVHDQKILTYDQYPQTEVLYAITPHSWEETIKNPAWEVETFQEASASLIWEEGEWRIYRVSK